MVDVINQVQKLLEETDGHLQFRTVNTIGSTYIPILLTNAADMTDSIDYRFKKMYQTRESK